MMPKGRAWRKPVTVLSGMVQQMDGYLEIMKKEVHKQNTVFIVTGKRGTGKTTAVQQTINYQIDIIAIDEIGPLELENKGWSDAILPLCSQWAGPMIWIVREKLIDDVVVLIKQYI